MSEAKFFEGYARWDERKERYETWDESVDRVMDMHKRKYSDKMSDELQKYLDEATESYKEKYVLGAQRALQFGGEQIEKHNMRLYNCTSTYADRPAFFQEIMYVLLTGAGAGFSVQKHHVAKLPKIQERKRQAKIFEAEDSIEGWANCIGVLMSSYFEGGGTFPEYEGRRVYFDLSKIRPKGSKISGGFKAPGPEPLRKALDKIEYLMQGRILKGESRLRPIDVYDISMFIADAVLAGGVRRAATIALFSLDDQEMLKAKTGNWLEENPQRARSNNSAIIVRDQITKEQFHEVFQSIKEYGEPGFVFTESTDFTVNPCVEIGMYPQIDGISGWQGCNLTEINGSKCKDEDSFYKACRAAAILGTLQAGYTDFPYLGETTKKIFDREALLGVSITGWMNSPYILFNESILKKGAEIIKKINADLSKLIGINQAARTTCTKPSGNASIILSSASGIHGEHSPLYIRNVQMNKDSEVAQLIKKYNPYMVEDSVWSTGGTDYVISFPVVSPENSIYRDQLYGVNLLEKVKFVQQTWVEAGTNIDLCVDPRLRHNVSNTINVRPEQWDEVEEYIFENRRYFAGVSLLPASGDKDYAQAPNTEVLTEQQILDKYGSGALFASGLIVDGLKVFSNLWKAMDVMRDTSVSSQERLDNQIDWIRRFKKFAANYFNNDLKKAEYCLKDVYIRHRWIKIQQNYKDIDFVTQLTKKKFTDIDTLGAIACSGGACEV